MGFGYLPGLAIAGFVDGDTVMLLPALAISESECDEMISLLKRPTEEVQERVY